MDFSIISVVLSLTVAVVLVGTLLLGNRRVRSERNYQVEFYAAKLKEIESDVAKGLIEPSEAERTRIEVSRRLLKEHAAVRDHSDTRDVPRLIAGLLCIAITISVIPGAMLVHSSLAGPYQPDMPLQKRIERASIAKQTRPTQEQVLARVPDWSSDTANADEEYVELVSRLRNALDESSGTIGEFSLLANHEAAIGNFRGAAIAKQRQIDNSGENASASDFVEYAEYLIASVQGYVSPEAETALNRALELNPQEPKAEYYVGLIFAQTGRPDIAIKLWSDLGSRLAPGDSLTATVVAAVNQAARLAGISLQSPSGLAPEIGIGEVASAATLSESEQTELILGMVSGLQERLYRDGGSETEWSRLIRSYAVLGKFEEARQALEQARENLADHDEQLVTLENTARSFGVSQ